jgi:hypothetical protein
VSGTADLVITNGDAAGELRRRSLQGAEVPPWRDVQLPKRDLTPLPFLRSAALRMLEELPA